VLGGLVALWIGWTGQQDLSTTSSSLTWIVVIPALLVGGVVWGLVENRRTGATSTRPGWSGPGAPPPPRSIAFMVPPTAGGRARLSLDVETALPQHVLLDAVRRVTAVRGNWFVVQGDHVEVSGAGPGELGLHIGGHCHFRARVQPRGARTALRVGGMDLWVQSRSYYFGVVPAGLAHVQGFFAYTLFLRTVGAEIARLDPLASLRIGAPS
jgi:hypothetical protein